MNLELDGFAVLEAAGLAAARAALAAEPVVVVVLDLGLGADDGAELLAAPRDYGVVLLTGADDPPQGAYAVIGKPFDVAELLEAVHAAAATSR